MPKSFSLHVKSSLKFPEQTENSISYGPPNTIKLEGNRVCMIDTGIRISNCNSDGYVIVEPYETYNDTLSFSETKLDSTSKQSVIIEIKNKTKNFTRIDPDNYLFTFKFIQKEKKAIKNYKRASPKIIIDNDTQEKNKIIVKKVPVVEEPIEAPVEAPIETVEHDVEAPIEAVEHDLETPMETVEHDVEEPMEAPIEAPIQTVESVVEAPVEQVVEVPKKRGRRKKVVTV